MGIRSQQTILKYLHIRRLKSLLFESGMYNIILYAFILCMLLSLLLLPPYPLPQQPADVTADIFDEDENNDPEVASPAISLTNNFLPEGYQFQTVQVQPQDKSKLAVDQRPESQKVKPTATPKQISQSTTPPPGLSAHERDEMRSLLAYEIVNMISYYSLLHGSSPLLYADKSGTSLREKQSRSIYLYTESGNATNALQFDFSEIAEPYRFKQISTCESQEVGDYEVFFVYEHQNLLLCKESGVTESIHIPLF